MMTDSETSPSPTLAEQRVAGCPFKPCRGADDNETMLRSIRSDRLLCMWCAVRATTGYMGKEEAKAHDDKFFTGTTGDLLIQAGLPLAASAIMNVILLLLPFSFFLISIIAGLAVGGAVGRYARRATKGRLKRQSAYIAVGGGVLGAVVGVTLFLLFQGVPLQILPRFVFNVVFSLDVLLGTGALAFGVWGMFQRRI